jgi:hypothetical protein
MAHQWLCSLTALLLVLPVVLGCGSSGGSNNNSGLSDKELAKMMEGAKEAAARAPGPDVTAEKLLESLTAEPSIAGPAKEAVAKKLQAVTGVVADRNSEKGESCYLTLDGGTHQGKAYKLKFNFSNNQHEEIVSVKVGDKARIVGATDGEIKNDTLEFKECIFYPANETQLSPGSPPPMPPVTKTK